MVQVTKRNMIFFLRKILLFSSQNLVSTSGRTLTQAQECRKHPVLDSATKTGVSSCIWDALGDVIWFPDASTGLPLEQCPSCLSWMCVSYPVFHSQSKFALGVHVWAPCTMGNGADLLIVGLPALFLIIFRWKWKPDCL